MPYDVTKTFLEDAIGDLTSARNLIGDNIQKNRRALRLLIEGFEKSIKALWLSKYDNIIVPFLEYIEKNKKRCRKRTLHSEIKRLKHPKHVGHAASLKVLKAIVDMVHFTTCLDECKLQPKELTSYIYNNLEYFIKEHIKMISKDKEFVVAVKQILEIDEDIDINRITQKLFNELTDIERKRQEKLENDIKVLLANINCESLKEIRKMIDDYIKRDRVDPKGKRDIVEDCMKINKEYIYM